MVFEGMNRRLLQGGLSIAAAMLISTAALGQDVPAGEPEEVVVQNWHYLGPAETGVTVLDEPDPATGGEGIAVGEPDPNGEGTEPVPVEDPGVEDPGLEDPGLDDPSVDDPADGGPDIVIDDGACIGEGCIPVELPVEGPIDDGEVIYYTLEDRSDFCIDCNVAMGGPVALSSNSVPEVQPETVIAHTAPTKHRSRAADVVLVSPVADCLAQHPRSAWICEWQNGTGQ